VDPSIRPTNTVDVQGLEGGGWGGAGGGGQGMGPDVNGPASTVVMSPVVDVLFCRLVEDEEELCLRIAQVHMVHLRAHGLTPLAQASQAEPVLQHWGHPPGLPVVPLPSDLSPSGLGSGIDL